jgi:hypothetical protein
MKKLLIGILVLSSFSVFAESRLGIDSKICKQTNERASAIIELYSKINAESSHYEKLQFEGETPVQELGRRVRKIEEAHAVVEALNAFCKD